MPTVPTPTRLLSPSKRRLYPNPNTGQRQKDSPLSERQRGDTPVGYADATTVKALRRAGWTNYVGPAETDPDGWVIPGSDPEVRPIL